MDTRLWELPRTHRYAILAKLGQGMYGKVYLALDNLTNRRVAIKKQTVGCELAAAEFATHAMLASFPCPHLMDMLDHFVEDGLLACLLA